MLRVLARSYTRIATWQIYLHLQHLQPWKHFAVCSTTYGRQTNLVSQTFGHSDLLLSTIDDQIVYLIYPLPELYLINDYFLVGNKNNGDETTWTWYSLYPTLLLRRSLAKMFLQRLPTFKVVCVQLGASLLGPLSHGQHERRLEHESLHYEQLNIKNSVNCLKWKWFFKGWPMATPSATRDGFSWAVDAAAKQFASGPCGVIIECSVAPPGWNPSSFASYFPRINPMNSLMQLPNSYESCHQSLNLCEIQIMMHSRW